MDKRTVPLSTFFCLADFFHTLLILLLTHLIVFALLFIKIVYNLVNFTLHCNFPIVNVKIRLIKKAKAQN